MTKAVIYLSGAMTNVVGNGAYQFDAARYALRAEGYVVLCPSELSAPNLDKPRHFHMRRDMLIILSAADEVCVLPGWEESLGSKLEVLIALEAGLSVWRYDDRAPVTIDMIKINVKEMAA